MGLLIFSSSCEPYIYGDDETVLAKAGENYLYFSDIEKNIPSSLSGSDSVQLANNLVQNWIKQNLLLQYANRNLPDSLKDFSQQLEVYENNLIIYAYKKRFVEQRLDTTVNINELENYYKSHLNEFQLKENIVQFVFAKIPNDPEITSLARELFENPNDTIQLQSTLRDFCELNAVDFFLNSDRWISFNELLTRVPLEVFNQEIYLRNNKFIEIEDKLYVYFVYLKDFKIKEEVSPFEFQKNKIRQIILNKRKINLLNELEDNIYQNALELNKFEIY